MGWFIEKMRTLLERVAGDNYLALRLGGGVITLGVVLGSVAVGWTIERLCFAKSPIHV